LGFYHHYVYPFWIDLALSSRAYRKARARTLAPAQGRILEIGFGTGHNLQYYPEAVSRIEAIDTDVDLDRYSQPRIAASRIDVDFHHLDAAHLPFGKESFDTVVSTLTLCSIPDVEHALGEVRRVLKPGGRFLFLEHGRAPDASLARWQDRLTPAWKPVGGGCHLNREMHELVASTGLRLDPVRSYYLKGIPRLFGYMTEGVATKVTS
jgi:ubiquinone/menaquinone biosynthesis C-methylase UbiE